MARKAIVTRTIIGTEVTVLGLDCVLAEPVNKTVIISGKYDDDKKLLKAVKKAVETEDYKVAKIVATAPCNKLIGMWEEDFIANAMELDPTTRKPLGSTDEVEEITE